jgi:truncated hemoglobin YjbI
MKRLFTVTMVVGALMLGSMNIFAHQDMAAHNSMGTMDKDKKHMKMKSLYVRLGGKKSIKAVVDEFVNNVAGDSRINSFFAKTASDPKRLKKFKDNLVDQICEASGGPCKYKGLDMKTAHKGMGVSSADFGALVEDLVKALDKFHVGETEKNELLGALGPMKGDIVEK